MLQLRTLLATIFAALLVSACGGSNPLEGSVALDPAPSATMAKAMATTSANVSVTSLPLLASGATAGARAINDVGQVVGMATDANGVLQRVVWDLTKGNAIVATLPNFDPSSVAEPSAINDGGEAAGTERISSTLREGVYWTAASGTYRAIGLPPLNNGSRIQITARDINNGGTIVGAAQDGSTGSMTAVYWTRNATGASSLGLIGEAFGVNDSGHAVGVYAKGSLSRAFLSRGGRWVDLGAVGGSGVTARATAISNTGLIAGTSDGDTIPVRWSYDINNGSSNPVLERLPLSADLALPAPSAINDAGDVVGSAWTSGFAGTRAVLWRNGQVIQLASFNSKAYGINNAGQIVGEGDANGDGRVEALLWTIGGGTTNEPPPPPPPPPPSTTNTAPTVSITSVGPTSLKVGGTLQLQASFADPDQGPWTYTIDWGDGSTRSTGSVSSPGSFSGSHTYLAASAKRGYTIRVTVRDAAGATGTASKGGIKVR